MFRKFTQTTFNTLTHTTSYKGITYNPLKFSFALTPKQQKYIDNLTLENINPKKLKTYEKEFYSSLEPESNVEFDKFLDQIGLSALKNPERLSQKDVERLGMQLNEKLDSLTELESQQYTNALLEEDALTTKWTAINQKSMNGQELSLEEQEFEKVMKLLEDKEMMKYAERQGVEVFDMDGEPVNAKKDSEKYLKIPDLNNDKKSDLEW